MFLVFVVGSIIFVVVVCAADTLTKSNLAMGDEDSIFGDSKVRTFYQDLKFSGN